MSLTILLVPVAVGVTTTIARALEKKVQEGNLYKIETVMKNEQFLQKALENYGCQIGEHVELGLAAEIGEAQIYFKVEQNGLLSAVFPLEIELEDAKEFITNIQQEYVRLVQEETYQKLITRAKEEGLILESEHQTVDNKRVLTFQVRG